MQRLRKGGITSIQQEVIDLKANRKTMIAALNRALRIRLAAESLADERTIAAVYSGRRVTSSSRLRIEEAARRLGYPLPPAGAQDGGGGVIAVDGVAFNTASTLARRR